MAYKIKVSLVDDHQVVLDGLCAVLAAEEEVKVIATAQSGEQLLELLKKKCPDIVVMDYSLVNSNNPGGINGGETAAKVMKLYPQIKILMLTMHDSEEVILQCIEMGVQGYMLKSEKNFDISAAIIKLYKQGFYFSPEVAAKLVLSINFQHSKDIELTSREKEILDFLYRGHSTKEIGDKLFISPHTVDSHRKHLLIKFEAKNSLHLVYNALHKGYLKVTHRGL